MKTTKESIWGEEIKTNINEMTHRKNYHTIEELYQVFRERLVEDWREQTLVLTKEQESLLAEIVDKWKNSPNL